MPDSGQATAPESSLDSLASFLLDNSATDGDEPKKENEQAANPAPDEDNAGEAQAGDQNAESDPETETESDDTEEKPVEEAKAEEKPSLKFKVPVKGDDGSDSTIEVDERELIAGYQRHADYTKKTQELGERERAVTQALSAKLQEEQGHYLQQAQFARQAVLQLAGLKSADEMAKLAASDPAMWVQESQRQQAIGTMLAQLEQGMQAELAKRQADASEQQKRAYAEAWQVLTKDGIDRPTLKGIFDAMATHYGVPQERLATVTDPALVRIMRDAAAYRELQTKKASVTKKADEAPRLPSQKQTIPRNERRAQELNKRFAQGKAKLNDLAAILM